MISAHSAMKCSHRIRVSFAGFEIDRRSTSTAASDGQTQKLADWSGKFFWRDRWAPFDDLRRIEVSLGFRSVRVASQIATYLAVRELDVFIFNAVFHIAAANSCTYKSQAKALSLLAKGRTSTDRHQGRARLFEQRGLVLVPAHVKPF